MDHSCLKNFLDSQGRLTAFPAKRKMKLRTLYFLAEKFEAGRMYTETQVNDLLCQWHTFDDPATLRRELYQENVCQGGFHPKDEIPYKLEFTAAIIN